MHHIMVLLILQFANLPHDYIQRQQALPESEGKEYIKLGLKQTIFLCKECKIMIMSKRTNTTNKSQYISQREPEMRFYHHHHHKYLK